MTLTRASVDVIPTDASLKAPDQVVAGENFKMEWEGPDNKGDFIAVVKKVPGRENILNTGTLKVIASTTGSDSFAAGGGPIELILDASGSMLQKLDGKSRISIARQ